MQSTNDTIHGNTQKEEVSTKEVTEILGVTEQTIYNYVRNGKMTPTNKQYRGKERHFVTEEDLSEFISKEFVHCGKRQVIFMPDTKYHLYQLFQHSNTKEAGRLLEIKSKQGGVSY